MLHINSLEIDSFAIAEVFISDVGGPVCAGKVYHQAEGCGLSFS